MASNKIASEVKQPSSIYEYNHNLPDNVNLLADLGGLKEEEYALQQDDEVGAIDPNAIIYRQ